MIEEELAAAVPAFAAVPVLELLPVLELEAVVPPGQICDAGIDGGGHGPA